MVSTRSGNTPSKKSSQEAKASSINKTLESLSLKSPVPSSSLKRTSRKPPRSRKSVKPSPKVNGRKLRQDANVSRQQQVKQQQIKDRRATSSTSSPSPHVGSDLVSTSANKLLERKTKAAGLAKSLLSVIKKVVVVGPNEINKDMFGFYNYLDTLTDYFVQFLTRSDENPNLRVYTFIKSEGTLNEISGHEDVIERFENDNLPIIMAVECEVEPMDYLANYDRKSDNTTFTTFQEAGFSWDPTANKNVYILSSSTNTSHDLLPIMKPSKIDVLKPSMLQADPDLQMLSITYKDVQIMARPSAIDKDVDEIINDEDKLSPDVDRVPLIQAVNAEKKRLEDKYSTQVDTEKSLFADLITSQAKENEVDESAIKTRLEALKIFKIYPKYDDDTLPPPKTVHGFCGPQISGNVKNPKYDDRSLFGLVNGFY